MIVAPEMRSLFGPRSTASMTELEKPSDTRESGTARITISLEADEGPARSGTSGSSRRQAPQRNDASRAKSQRLAFHMFSSETRQIRARLIASDWRSRQR